MQKLHQLYQVYLTAQRRFVLFGVQFKIPYASFSPEIAPSYQNFGELVISVLGLWFFLLSWLFSFFGLWGKTVRTKNTIKVTLKGWVFFLVRNLTETSRIWDPFGIRSFCVQLRSFCIQLRSGVRKIYVKFTQKTSRIMTDHDSPFACWVTKMAPQFMHHMSFWPPNLIQVGLRWPTIQMIITGIELDVWLKKGCLKQLSWFWWLICQCKKSKAVYNLCMVNYIAVICRFTYRKWFTTIIHIIPQPPFLARSFLFKTTKWQVLNVSGTWIPENPPESYLVLWNHGSWCGSLSGALWCSFGQRRSSNSFEGTWELGMICWHVLAHPIL